MNHRGKPRQSAPKGPPPGVTLFDPSKFQDKGQAAQAPFAPPGGTPLYGQVGGQDSWGAQNAQGTQGGVWNSWNWDADNWGSQTESVAEQTPKLSGQTPPPQQPQHQQHQHPQHHYHQQQQQPLQQEQNHHLGQQQQQQQQQWEQQDQQYDQWNAWNQSNHLQGEAGNETPANQMMQGTDQQQQPYEQWHQQQQQQQYWHNQGSNQGTEGSGQWSTEDGQWPQTYGDNQTGYDQQYGQYGHLAGGDGLQGQGGEVGRVQQGYQGSYGQGFEHSTVERQDGQQFPSSQEQAAVLESFSSESVSGQQGFLQAGSSNPSQGHSSPVVNFFSPESSGNQSDFLQQSSSSDFLQQSASSDFLDQSSNSESLDRPGVSHSSATHSSNQSEKSESSPPRDLAASQSRDLFGSLPEDRSQDARSAPSLGPPPIVASFPEEEQEMGASRGLSVGFAVPNSDESRLKVNMFQRTDSGISNASLSTFNYSVSSTSLEDREEKQAVDDLADQMDSVLLGDDQQPARGSSSDLNHSAAEGQGMSTPGGAAVEEDMQSSNMGDWEFVQKAQSLTSSSSQHSRASSLDQAVTTALVGPPAEGGSSSEEPPHPSSQHPPHQSSPQPQAGGAPQLGSSAPPVTSAPQGAFAPPAPLPSAPSSVAGVQLGGEGRTLGGVSQQTMAPLPVSSTSPATGTGSSSAHPSETQGKRAAVSISETTRALEEMTAGLSSLVHADSNGTAGHERGSDEAARSRPRPQDQVGRGHGGGNPLPDMFKKPGAPPKSMGPRPPVTSASAAREGPPPAASLATQKRQPGGYSSAFSKVPTSRAKHNISPATTLWENPDPPAANILLAPAAAPVLAPVTPIGSSAALAPALAPTTFTARSSAPPSLVPSATSANTSNPAGVDSGTSMLTESSMALPSQRPSSRGEGRSQARDGRRGRGYGDDTRVEDDNRSMNSLDELDAIAEPADDPRGRRQREYYGHDPQGYDRRRYKEYKDRYGEDRYDRPRSRHEDERPSSRSEVERPQSRSEVDKDRRYRYDYDRGDPYYRDRYRGYGYDYYARPDTYDRYYDPYYGRDSRYARGYQEEMKYRQAQYQERYPQDYWGRQVPGESYEQGSLYSGSRGNTPGPDESFYYYHGRTSRSSSRLGYEEPGSEHYHNSSAYAYDPYSYEYYHGEGYDYSGYQQEYTPGRMTPHKFNIPHVRACFGPGGQLVKVLPNRPADGQPAVVELHEVSAMLPDSPTKEELSGYPGPLLRNNTHKNDVLLFCQKKARACAENIGMVDRESAELIWRLLELMIKQNGTLVGSDLAELLLSGHEPSYEEYEGLGGLRITTSTDNLDTVGLDQTDAVPDYSAVVADRSQINTGRSRGEVTGRFRHLLFYGRKKDALEWAMKNDLWGHALFLASKMDNRTHANVMTRFANNAMRMNDPLQSLYQLMSGRQPAAVTCICDEGWGDWRPHLAMMLSNHTQRTDLDRKCMASLGDTLASKGFLHGSHFCYLMAQCKFGPYSKKTSKLVLIGANHYLPVMEFASNEVIQCTEVFEYAQSLGQVGFIIHHFQVYKFLYATRLAEYGFPQEALHYCEVVAQNVVNAPAFYNPMFVRLLYNLSCQLKMHDPQLLQGSQEEGEEPAWLTRLSQTLMALQDGSIQPVSGQATPSFLPTATSSESGDITSASLENFNAQYQGYSQETAYVQEGYGLPGETTYNQDAAYQQQYGFQQQEGLGTAQTGLEGYGQPQAMGEGQAGQVGQQAAGNMAGWDAAQSAQVPPIHGYNGQQWEGHYAQTYAHQYMAQGDSTDGAQTQPEVTQGEGGQTQGGYPPQPQQAAGQRGSFASTASVTASVEDDGEDDDNANEGEQSGSSFDYFGAATAHKIIAPPSRFRTNSTSSTGSHQRQRTVSESSTSSISVANPKRDAPHSPKKTQAVPPPGPDALKNQKGGGWFGGLFSKFSKPKNQMKLPDDKDPSIVWDSEKKRWVNTDESAEASQPPPPPPRDADISAPPPPGSMPPPSGTGNRYSLNKAGGSLNKYVDVLNPGKSNGNPPLPSNIFSVLPPASTSTSASAASVIFNPSGPGGVSSQGQVPSVVAEPPTGGGEAAEQPTAAPPAGPMLFNPAQFQHSKAPTHAAASGGPKFGQRRKYPKP